METLTSKAFYALTTPEPVSGMSVLQAVVIEGDVRTTKDILYFSPGVIDVLISLTVPVTNSSVSKFRGKTLEEILKVLDTPPHKNIQELLRQHCGDFQERSLIHLAARQGNVHQILRLIANGADIIRPSLEQGEEYATVLNCAAERNSIDVIEELLRHGASLQAKDYRGFNAIHFAARAGRTETVMLMLDRDISLRDAVGQGYTPLHLAAWGGHIETVELLISQGADVNIGRQHESYDGIIYDVYPESDFCAGIVGDIGDLTLTDVGTTPIMLAAAGGHLETFEFLKHKGGRIDQALLIPAVKGGNLILLKELVCEGFDVKARSCRGKSLLHYACTAEVADYLIQLGLDVNVRDEDEETPLHSAASKGNVMVANVLINYGCDVTATIWSGFSALALAVSKNNPDPKVVSYFAEKWKQSGKDNATESSPFFFADRFGPEVAKILLDCGFDVNKKHCNMSPLHRAAKGNPETFRVLLEHGADIHSKDSNGYEPCHIAAMQGNLKAMQLLLNKDPGSVQAVDSRGRTALHWAVEDSFPNIRTDNCECVQLLLRRGSDLLAKDINANTPLHKASARISEILLKYAVIVQKDITVAVNKEGFTALHEAAQRFIPSEKVELLLKSGFAIDAIDHKGRTPLHLAVKNWESDSFNVLLENGADETKVDNDGNTLLHSAADTGCPGDVNVMEKLFFRGFKDVNSRNAEGKTPLHFCCAGGGYEKARFLLENGADVNAVDNTGYTALHLAAGQPFLEVLEILIENGACINGTDNYGNTPLHIAAYGHMFVYSRLIELGADATIVNMKGETPDDIVQRTTGQDN